MGIFGSRRRTFVGTTINRVIPNESLSTAAERGVLLAMFSDEEEARNHIGEYIMDETLNGLGMRVERAYRYAAQGLYEHGLPSGAYLSGNLRRNAIQAVLDGLEGVPPGTVEIEYAEFGPPNTLHLAWMRLIEQHGYNPVTNQIGSLSAIYGPTFLKDIAVVIPVSMREELQQGGMPQWGVPPKEGITPERPLNTGGGSVPGVTLGSLYRHTPIHVDPQATEEYVKVIGVLRRISSLVPIEDDPNNLELRPGLFAYPELIFEVDQFPVDQAKDYFHAKYRINGVEKYWMYESGTGTYPSLDSVFNTPPETNGTYFPFTYFRLNKAPVDNDTNSSAYKTSKRYLQHMGLSYQEIIDQVNENPDIDDVEQAMLMLGVPANTQDPLELKYLYEYFNNQYLISANQFNATDNYLINQFFQPQQAYDEFPRNVVVIQDKVFKMALSNSGIYKKRVGGLVSPEAVVGDVTGGQEEIQIPFTYIDNETGYPVGTTVKTTVHWYRRQVSNAVYEEIKIENLQLKYHIIGNYSVVADDDDPILLIPLDRSITSKYKLNDRERIYARSLHMVFNSVQTIKVKWYQTSFFGFFLTAVGIALTFYSLGTDGGLFAAIAAGSATAITAAAWALLVNI
ncbi:MAG: hypothetical protein E6R03_03975, partial [Hyphomicrobiaceae bacterium]